MKRFFSFLIALLFTFTAFGSHSVMSFSMQESTTKEEYGISGGCGEIHNIKESLEKLFLNISSCSISLFEREYPKRSEGGGIVFKKNPCTDNHDCCYESNEKSSISLGNHNPKGEEKKDISKYKPLLDTISFSLSSLFHKNLSHIHSPPILSRKIKNYSYSTFTKIIKSNT